MARITHHRNPFDASRETDMYEVGDGGLTVRQWLEKTWPGFVEFNEPTVCMVNGRHLFRPDWFVYKMKTNDSIAFISIARGFDPFTWLIIALVITVGFSVYTILTLPHPKLPGDVPEPDPVYGLSGQRNQNKLNNPIECPYGRNRLWPSYAARPYTKFIGNDQWFYGLYCLGQGSFSIEATQIEDTPIANFQDITVEIYEPGDSVTLFPDNVVTSSEVAGVEIFATNEDDYVAPGAGFIANEPGTQTNHLEVDLVFPQGLYVSNNDGSLGQERIVAAVEYREVDESGVPVGAGTWILPDPLTTSGVVEAHNFTKLLATNTPQRFTYEIEVALGRYAVRVNRPTTKTISARNGNVLQWQSLRSFLPSTKDFGAVTLLAMKAKASNNLNDNAANRLNVIATRKLPIYDADTETWSSATATRNPIWALTDAFKNALYGGRLPDSRLFLSQLAGLADDFEADDINFDLVFDQRITVWEAAKTVCRVGRSLPILSGSRISVVRDTVKTVPTSLFSVENMAEGTFILEAKLPGENEFDGVEVEYIDPVSFLPETVLCLVGSDAGNYPEKIRLPGCTDRDVAYREGLYLRRSKLLKRLAAVFETGMEGRIPIYGDLVGISHDLPRWGASGIVLEINEARTVITLSEPVTFESGTHVVMIRTRTGEAGGPYTVTVGDTDKEVVLAAPLPDVFLFDPQAEFPVYLFGKSELWGKNCVVINTEPRDEETVLIRAVPYDADVFAGDVDTAPAIPGSTTPPAAPSLPVVTGLEVLTVPNTPLLAQIVWKAALGAVSYVVQTSTNGEDYETVATPKTPFVTIDVRPGDLWVRVAGINVGAGPWAEWDGMVTPDNLYPSDTNTDIADLEGYVAP